jgi:hypothetical protein
LLFNQPKYISLLLLHLLVRRFAPMQFNWLSIGALVVIIVLLLAWLMMRKGNK